MEYVYALVLALLEMTFISVALGLLHNLRKTLGLAPFYLALGMFFFFALIVGAADIRVSLFDRLDFQLMTTVFSLPFMAALLMIYITDGTVEAKRLIIGFLVLFGLFLYVGDVTQLQLSWRGFVKASGFAEGTLDMLLDESRRRIQAAAAGCAADVFLLPVLYSQLKKNRVRQHLAVFASLLVAQLADASLYLAVLYRHQPVPVDLVTGTLLIRSLFSCWVSILLSVYLSRIEDHNEPDIRAAFDIVWAFFGGSRRTRHLEKLLQEWQGRYRQLMQEAGEMILLLDSAGCILEANRAALKILGLTGGKASGRLIFEGAQSVSGDDLPRFPLSRDQKTPIRFEVIFASGRRVNGSLSLLQMQSGSFPVMIGRDVTEEARLAEEKERLSEQLAHSQRIESIGQLAGGVAHDFNNHLHAILGHVDVIRYLHPPEDPVVVQHLEKIAVIAEESGKLTSQLLGFARRGQYRRERLLLTDLIRKSFDLLTPKHRAEMNCHCLPPSRECRVCGDPIQLEQVLVNLLLNAYDGLKGRPDPEIIIRCGPAADAPLTPVPPDGIRTFDPADYCFFSVTDNGCGMSRDMISRIFEPFFTTKPVGQGTGMGLALVYGAVIHHHGWPQVESTPGKGSTFCIFLPVDTADIRDS